MDMVFGRMRTSNLKAITDWTKSKALVSISGKTSKSTKDSSKMTVVRVMVSYIK
jgi:hypothetical protein